MRIRERQASTRSSDAWLLVQRSEKLRRDAEELAQCVHRRACELVGPARGPGVGEDARNTFCHVLHINRLQARVADYLTAQLELSKYPEEGFDQIFAAEDVIPASVRRCPSSSTERAGTGGPVCGRSFPSPMPAGHSSSVSTPGAPRGTSSVAASGPTS